MNSAARLLMPAAFLLGIPLNGIACTYAGPPPAKATLYNSAAVVFVGKVTEIRPTPVITTKVINGKRVSVGTAASQVRLAVDQALWGSPGAEVTLARAGTSCDPSFTANGTYLVFGEFAANGTLLTDERRSFPLSEVAEVLKYIDGARSNRPQAFLHGEIQRKQGGPAGFKWWQESFTVQAEANGVVFEIQSLADGGYELTLPPGEYRVRVLRNGMPASDTQRVVLPAGEIKRTTFDAFPRS